MVFAVAAILLIVFAGVVAYVRKKHLYIWMPSYFRNPPASALTSEPIDVMLLLVDHFELAGKKERLDAWVTRYPELAARHHDADGRPPQHTWFYAIDLLHQHELPAIRDLVDQGLGEVELHWHHSHSDSAQYRHDLREGLFALQQHGFMRPYLSGQTACFAFIHGNWSLGNSRGAEFCGIDNEIEILLEEGCYADFTFPALFCAAQPNDPNRILYAKDDGNPKSYDRGRPARVGVSPQSDELQIFQGPLTINWRDWRFSWHPAIEDGDINRSKSHDLPARIDSWIRRRVHVADKPNWCFVKLFCHGAQDYESVLGSETDRMLDYLERNYNDGRRYRLHYVTAREAYNIVRAAEDGRDGDPNEFRDYVIPHPQRRKAIEVPACAE